MKIKQSHLLLERWIFIIILSWHYHAYVSMNYEINFSFNVTVWCIVMLCIYTYDIPVWFEQALLFYNINSIRTQMFQVSVCNNYTLSVKQFVRKFAFSWVALNDTKTRLSLMTRHGSYWNNIIITRVATSFFRVNLRQGRHRIRFYMIIVYIIVWDLVWHIFFFKLRTYLSSWGNRYIPTGKVGIRHYTRAQWVGTTFRKLLWVLK